MSVYKEMGAGYLTRTKDLILAGEEKWYRLDSAASDVCLRSKQRFTRAGKVLPGALLAESTPGTAFYGTLLGDVESN